MEAQAEKPSVGFGEYGDDYTRPDIFLKPTTVTVTNPLPPTSTLSCEAIEGYD